MIMFKSNPLKNFPPVYYVTLEECIERQEKIESEFLEYGIKINPIKSKRFSESNDIITGKYLYQLTGPTQGCIVSHLKAIKTWYESEESDYAFFCEDDLSLKTVKYWNFEWEEFIERLPDDCECVQLMTIRGDFDGVYFRERQWNDWSETAYIMNRDYAKKILENYCLGETFHLELKDSNVMPIGENILFTSVGKVYTFPLFVENVEIHTTDVNDTEVENGQKPNHIYSSEYVYDWWKNFGKTRSINELMKINIKNKMNHNIVDCFTYFNEKEILELRINLLKDYVDKFVIVDANYTHSGVKKEFTCKKTIRELGLPEDIIEVIEVDLSIENLDPPSQYDLFWDSSITHASRERLQRDFISRCLKTNNFDDDTIFIVGDCDEILNPKYLSELSDRVRSCRDKIFKVDLDYLQGRADLKTYFKDGTEVEWRYSLFLCLKEHMQNTPLSNIRADKFNPYPIVWPYNEQGSRMTGLGWHFSWMGTNQDRLEKSKYFCHSGQIFDFSTYNEYGSSEMNEFMSSYVATDGSDAPTGYKDNILHKYPLENLPSTIFDIPRLKDYFLPNIIEKKVAKTETKTELEELLYNYSLDTENPEYNFALGIWYETNGHTAPGLSYFLRCAERAADTDKDLAYEALIRGSHCYDKQGTRDGSARSLLWQAQMFLPERPEAYYLLARFAEKREWWQDCYSTCDLCLRFCNFNLRPLRTDVGYPGKYGLMFVKATSGWWWGKGDESRKLLHDILNNHELPENDISLIKDNLSRMNG